MQSIIKHVVPTNGQLITCGQLNEKVLLELRMVTSLYKYMEVVTNFYDDEEQPYFNNWTDIEGMGYGWAWLNHEENDWHTMMAKRVSCEADSFLKDMEKTLYFVYEHESVKTYHFICLRDCREDKLISFSNSEISFV